MGCGLQPQWVGSGDHPDCAKRAAWGVGAPIRSRALPSPAGAGVSRGGSGGTACRRAGGHIGARSLSRTGPSRWARLFCPAGPVFAPFAAQHLQRDRPFLWRDTTAPWRVVPLGEAGGVALERCLDGRTRAGPLPCGSRLATGDGRIAIGLVPAAGRLPVVGQTRPRAPCADHGAQSRPPRAGGATPQSTKCLQGVPWMWAFQGGQCVARRPGRGAGAVVAGWTRLNPKSGGGSGTFAACPPFRMQTVQAPLW